MNTGRTALVLALLAFLSFAWLSPQDPGNAQIVTRLALTLSILERGRLDIAPWADRTIDKSEFEGQFYADKAPGQPLLGLPSAAVARLVMGLQGENLDGTDPQVFARYSWWTTVGTNGLLSALAIALLFTTAMRLGASRAGAVFGTVSFGFATPFFGWSTTYFAHTVSASLLVFVLALMFTLPLGAGEKAEGDGKPLFLPGLAIGLLLGFAVAVDLTSGPMSVVAGLVALVLALRRGRGPLVALVGGMALGGLVGVLPLLIYNQLVFHSPFKLGYASVVGFSGMQQGFFGITLPDPAVFLELMFGLYRGLLPLSPVLLLVPLGLYRMARVPHTRPAVVMVVAAMAIYLWINSSYVYWSGGYSTGPRHLVPMLPFLGLALCFAWPRSVAARAFAIVLLIAGLVMSLVSASVTMFAPEHIKNPIVEELIPRFFAEARWMRALPVALSWIVFAVLLVQAERNAPMHRRRIAAAPV